MALDHDFERHNPCPDPGHCHICDGGLKHCVVCGGAESSLPKRCPGVRLSEQTLERITKGQMNFDGEWYEPDHLLGHG